MCPRNVIAALLLVVAVDVACARVCPDGLWWRPQPRTSWQWQLSGTIDTSKNVAMYDIDLLTDQSVIDTLHAAGRVVICYYSAGTAEKGRPDYSRFPAASLGKKLPDWPQERWVDFRMDAVKQIMIDRLDLAASKGCDGVEPDNVDGAFNNNGLGLSKQDQLQYNRWTAQQAHARGLSVGLKNDLDQVAQLQPLYDWALNEQCVANEECDALLPFVENNKAVFGAEYTGSADEVCQQPNELNYDFLMKTWDLDASGTACRTYDAGDSRYTCVSA
eukprot:m51a1_g13818 putative endo alpha- polygalactosaminidase (274) ;mRNA; f:422251-423382